MRSAGLKNITAKHLGKFFYNPFCFQVSTILTIYFLLALASQALSIMISLIPYIRETLRRHLNPKQAVMLTEFDKLKRDYQEHQNEIHAKLVAIMGDRLMLHCKTLEVSFLIFFLFFSFRETKVAFLTLLFFSRLIGNNLFLEEKKDNRIFIWKL